MTRFVTLNQFVNTWECDENDHMNVQFYYAKFDDAARVFAVCHDLDAGIGARISRHVRYHSELRGGEQIRILSSIVLPDDNQGGPEGHFYIQHCLEETVSGQLAATALDCYQGRRPEADAAILDTISAKAKPRAINHPADCAFKTASNDLSTTVLRGVLHPALCDENGEARDQAYIGAVSDAASHAWDRVGLSTGWLNEQSYGRVAVEMRLCVHDPMRVGDLYQLQLAFTGLQSRAFTKRYDFFNLKTGAHIAFLEATAMILNHTTRRSEPLPAFAREAIGKQLT